MARTYFLHGFTQSAASWRHLIDRVPGAQALDLPGHGAAASEPTDFDRGTASLVARGGSGSWIGYSMGGRYALHVALAAPHLVERLVLVGAHPGLEDLQERRARAVRDAALADRIEEVGVPVFLDEWLGQPLFAGLTPEAQGLDARAGNTSTGLAAALRGASVGVQRTLWEALPSLSMPVLYVVGERDAKYRALGARVVEALGGRAELEVVAGAGHAVPFENPDGFLEALASWYSGFFDSGAAGSGS